ncbi:hypothetical protein P7H79_05655 [Lactococcus lactis]|uniref:hypothetical protein n=1 Tax=Lactococcus lactis TaxID=1358 RepID=UPI0028928961|nr:hypothetical protein [Lactococcus lactis]MDT2872853.1 hypothetical protein [Lactococcus lactis]MDT2934690.1 hypothetical protein [Lactococcus lactis]
MLELHNQYRACGKTSKVIELMEQDESVLCLVPNSTIKRHNFPKELQKRILVGVNLEHLIDELRTMRFTKLFVDELSYSKFYLAKLFYELGRNNIQVIVFGTEQ